MSAAVVGRRYCSSSKAKEYYAPLQREAFDHGVVRVLDLSDIRWVNDPHEVLPTAELNLHRTQEDKEIRASFKCIPDEVLFGFFKGYVYRPTVIKQYNAEQVAWYSEMKQLLGEREHHDPQLEEQLEEFFGCGTSTFFRFRFSLLHPELMLKIHSWIKTDGVNYLYELYGVPDPCKHRKALAETAA